MTQPQQPPRLLTVAEAAERLGIGRPKLYELMSSGEIAFVKLPPFTQQAARRIEESEVAAFIERHRQPATP